MSDNWKTTYQFNNRLLNLRRGGVDKALGMHVIQGDGPNDERGYEQRLIDALPDYGKGLATQIPLAVATEAARRKAILEAQEVAKARSAWYDVNAVSKPSQLIQKAASGAEVIPMQEPAKVGLRRVATETVKALPEMAGSMVKGAGIAQSIGGALEGAYRGYNTPTETYAERNSMSVPESTVGKLGLRSLGVMQDVGNAITFGLPEKHFWKK